MSSNPIENVDGSYIAGEVALLKGSDPLKTCLLVEGQDDSIVYKRLIDDQFCQITICYGVENLRTAIEMLNQQKTLLGYLGIKDADFDMLAKVPVQPNLLLTDGHDLEVMICNSEALDRFIEVRLRGEPSTQVDVIKLEIRAKLFELGAMLGYMHWQSFNHSWGIEVHSHKLLQNCLNENWVLPFNDCIAHLKKDYPHINESVCVEHDFYSLANIQALHLCKGHDLIIILAIIIPGITKSLLKKKINPGNDIAGGLFLAYDNDMFKRSYLYREISNWEHDNHPFRVLVA